MAPEFLRALVTERLREALARYDGPAGGRPDGHQGGQVV